MEAPETPEVTSAKSSSSRLAECRGEIDGGRGDSVQVLVSRRNRESGKLYLVRDDGAGPRSRVRDRPGGRVGSRSAHNLVLKLHRVLVSGPPTSLAHGQKRIRGVRSRSAGACREATETIAPCLVIDSHRIDQQFVRLRRRRSNRAGSERGAGPRSSMGLIDRRRGKAIGRGETRGHVGGVSGGHSDRAAR